MKHFSTTLLSVFLLGLQACSDSNDSESSNSDVNDTEAGLTSVQLGVAGELAGETEIDIPTTLRAASRAMIFDYTMTSVTGGTTTARAQLFEPDTDAPAEGFPLVVWAHGTTGISNVCQPSLSFDNFGNEVAVNALLSAGYSVLAPDYEGFGTPQIHPYYQRASHTNAILDAIPAAHAVTNANFSDDWALVGHSQGGAVALEAARGSIPAEYPLQAVVALAPGTDLVAFSDFAFDAIDLDIAEGNTEQAAERLFYMNVYSAFVAFGFQEVEPDFNPASIFGDEMSPLIDEAVNETQCGEYASSVNDALSEHLNSGGTPADFRGLRRDWYDAPLIAARLEAEEFGVEAQSAPLLIVQGDADRQIPIAATTAFVDRQRSLGTDVTYEVLAGARHGDVARADFNLTISWLAEQFPP